MFHLKDTVGEIDYSVHFLVEDSKIRPSREMDRDAATVDELLVTEELGEPF